MRVSAVFPFAAIGVTLALGAPVAISVSGLDLPVQTLDGQARSFPKDADEHRSIFIVTFTKAASAAAASWTRRLSDTKAGLPAAIFQVSVIEDVPKMFRSSVVSGIRHSFPPDFHGRFWVSSANSAEWQRLTAAVSLKEPHVFVLDGRGDIVWRAHGEVSDAKIGEIAALPPAH